MVAWLPTRTMLAALLLCASSVSAASAASTELPRLVVLVSVDQLREGQLDRLAEHLDGGLGRFLREGHRLHGALLPYAASETGPGHVSFATGCLPVTHGVVGNEWTLRKDGSKVYCVGGPSGLVAASGPVAGSGRDASNLERATLGDLMRQRWPEARVVGVSGKDRGAIGMAGARATTALWWDRGGRGWLSSDAYGERLPSWASDASAAWPDLAAGWTWTPGFGAEDAPRGTGPDARAGEGRLPGGDGTLPWTLRAPEGEADASALARMGSQVYSTPLMDALTLDLAQRAVEGADLGGDAVPDLLTVSLSACDAVGHMAGPLSVEATDTILRADDGLGALFALLDARVGEGRWVACLSADHGVVDLPEHQAARGAYGLRITGADQRPLRAALRAKAEELYGSPCGVTIQFREVRLDEAAVREAGGDPAVLRRELAQVVRDQASWVEQVFTYEELIGSGAAGVLGMYQRSSRPDSAPDLELHTRPGVYVGFDTGTSHGSAHAYDRSVPLAFLGGGVAPGLRDDPASSLDAVPSLLALLGWSAEELAALDLDGRDLGLQR